MFIKGDIFERLLCCRRKVSVDENEDKVVEEQIVLQHTNNNKTEYITSAQLLERLKGGTTAVVALVREKRLVVAWLGDSLALLVRQRTPVHIVEPHTPEKPSERKRIEELGGCVVDIQGTWRVLGQLAVSRAIGDVNHKPFVSSECDIKSLDICGDEDFLILACDGLWDNLSPENAVNIVYSYLSKNDGDTDGVGRCLVEAARSSGSEDNITAVVVFLRPVDVLMEEESARVGQGQVPETESFVLKKDALPPSINAIFSPPENFISAACPPPVAEVPPETNGSVPHSPDMNRPIPSPVQEEPEECPPDYDSDEGVGADISVEKEKEAVGGAQALNPTDEEVDAALAELDSIPDGGCETGEVEEEDEEDEGWSYYKMEPQKDSQNEDLILADTSDFATLQASGGIASPQPSPRTPDSTIAKDGFSPSVSPPQAPSSPRTVEGFVTSVELNTPEESYNTNLAINQTTEYFNGGQLEQSSGPFSVYVSSSPEPAGIESPPVNLVSSIEDSPNTPFSHPDIVAEEPLGYLNPVKEELKEETEAAPEGVEIVHAQSTVEVLTGEDAELMPLESSEVPDIMDQSPSTNIPDIMTQSVTGILPSEPFVPSTFEADVPSAFEAEPLHKTPDMGGHPVEDTFGDHFAHTMAQEVAFETNIQNVPSTFEELQECIPASDVIPDLMHREEIESQPRDLVNTEPPVLIPEPILDPLVEGSIEMDFDTQKSLTNERYSGLNLMEAEVPEPLENRFTDMVERYTEVDRSFEGHTNQMITSFHESRTDATDLLASFESPAVAPPVTDEHLIQESTVEPTNVLEIENLTDKLDELEVSEEPSEVPGPTTPVALPIVDAKKPASAPRTSLSKPAPKPSPRSVGAKPSAAPADKRPVSLGTGAPKPLRKPAESALSKPSPTATTKSRTASSSTAASRTTRIAATSSVPAKTKTTPKSSVPPARTRPLTKTTPTTTKSTVPTATKTTPTSTVPSTKRATGLTGVAPVPRSKSATGTTGVGPISARRVTSQPPSALSKSLTTSSTRTTTKVSSASVGSKATTRTTTATTTRTSTLAATKRPISATATTKPPTTSSTTRAASATTTRKPLSGTRTTTTTTSSSTLKQKSAGGVPTATKDSKNTTNRLLSTTKTSTGTKLSPATKTTTTTATRIRSTGVKSTKTPGLKSKKVEEKTPASALANGENKIVDEETAVEVKEKLIMENTTSEESTETQKTIELVSNNQENILVNGDH